MPKIQERSISIESVPSFHGRFFVHVGFVQDGHEFTTSI